jgi:hypothetical protein
MQFAKLEQHLHTRQQQLTLKECAQDHSISVLVQVKFAVDILQLDATSLQVMLCIPDVFNQP